MALTSANVRVAVTGAVYRGATTATAPTSTSSATTGFTELGYVGQDGVREQRTLSMTDIKAWQNNDVVRTVVTDGKVTFRLTLIETAQATLETFYGTTGTTGVGEGSIPIKPSATGGRYSWIIDVVDGAKKDRIYVSEGEVTDRGELIYANGEAIGYEIEITAYPNTSGDAATKFTTALAS